MYIGIDQSFTNSGIVILNKEGQLIKSFSKSFTKISGAERYMVVYNYFDALSREFPDYYYALEDYAFGKKFKREKMGEIRSLIILALVKNGIKPYIIPIKTHKKAITGNGNASKDYVELFIKKTFNLVLSNNDEYDAFSIAYTLYKYKKDLSLSFGSDVSLYKAITCIE